MITNTEIDELKEKLEKTDSAFDIVQRGYEEKKRIVKNEGSMYHEDEIAEAKEWLGYADTIIGMRERLMLKIKVAIQELVIKGYEEALKTK